MPIDPVIPLFDEICAAEAELQRQRAQNAISYSPRRDEVIALMLGRIALLYEDLHKLTPTSPIGAGALLRLVWRWLPSQYRRYEQHLARIAGRLQAGRRSQDDLIWLRALAAALEQDGAPDGNARVLTVLNAAILGAARPLLIFRSAFRDTPTLEELSRGFWLAPFNRPSQS